MRLRQYNPHELLTRLAEQPELRGLYVFTYPYAAENDRQQYYEFQFGDQTRGATIAYRDRLWAQIHGRLEKQGSPFPQPE